MFIFIFVYNFVTVCECFHYGQITLLESVVYEIFQIFIPIVTYFRVKNVWSNRGSLFIQSGT